MGIEIGAVHREHATSLVARSVQLLTHFRPETVRDHHIIADDDTTSNNESTSMSMYVFIICIHMLIYIYNYGIKNHCSPARAGIRG